MCQDAERAYILIRARCIHEASGVWVAASPPRRPSSDTLSAPSTLRCPQGHEAHNGAVEKKGSSMSTVSHSLESGCGDNGGDDCEVFARVVEWVVGSLSRDLVIELTDLFLGCLPCGCDAL